ncbi:hypothetical protein [Parafrankia sp. EUN1f]|uniref:hypothetical protein n=1 Tax=Parafrankia sp. EUN1f TaxID=102897 RepID=UPI0001C46CE6|nr:hypothetical protein [Parafrankia sp. EUN1f]EFC80249.1 hypothetical protein FrEUN1fDRAFT_6643 [Parafrankia sp. EUN1f]
MARTDISAGTLTPTGVDPFPSSGDAANGHQFTYSTSRMFCVRNGSGASITVTVRANGTVDGLTVPDRTVTVAAGASRLIDTRASIYRQNDGYVYIDLSSSTTVVVGVVDLGRAT